MIAAVFFVLVLSAALLARPSVRFEAVRPGRGDQYVAAGLFGERFLFRYGGGSVPEIRRIGADHAPLLKIDRLTYGRKTCAVLITEDGTGLYDCGDYAAGYQNGGGLKTMSSFVSDYDGDGNGEIFLLLGKEDETYADRLIILSPEGGKLEKTYDESFRKLKPWKVQVCDVDGDGEKEVSLGVYTVAKYHPVYAKRPFLYEFYNHKLYPKWLGSRLSRPFDDYVFCDVDSDGADELVSAETTREGKKELNAYRWTGFGFESIGVSDAYDSVAGLASRGGSVTAVCGGRSAKGSKTFAYHNGKMEEEGSD